MSETAQLALERYVVEVPGQPYAKARARFTAAGRKRAYTDDVTATHEQAIGWALRGAGVKPFPGNVGVEATFYRSNKQRIDVDNLMKAVLDGATGIAWDDDSQVTRIAGTLEYDKDNPRTVIEIYTHYSSMARGEAADLTSVCPTCGKEFTWRRYASIQEPKKFCSNECRQRRRGKCPECGDEFVADGSRQRFCSKPCAAASKETRARISRAARKRARPKNTCRDCGAELARRTAVLCRTCWLTGRKGRRKADVVAQETP